MLLRDTGQLPPEAVHPKPKSEPLPCSPKPEPLVLPLALSLTPEPNSKGFDSEPLHAPEMKSRSFADSLTGFRELYTVNPQFSPAKLRRSGAL